MVFKTDLSFLTLLQYYSKKYIIKHYYFIVVGGLLGFFGTASIYKCSAATECSHRMFAMLKVLGVKVSVTF